MNPFPFGFGEDGNVAYAAGVPGCEGAGAGKLCCAATEPVCGVLGGPGVHDGPSPDVERPLTLTDGEAGNVLDGNPNPTPALEFGVIWDPAKPGVATKGDCAGAGVGKPLDTGVAA